MTGKFLLAAEKNERCYACERKLGKNPYPAVTEDHQLVFVGSECYKQITPQGYKPPKGSPTLYKGKFSPAGELLEIIKQ